MTDLDPVARLDAHFRCFGDLVARAESLAGAGRDEAAAVAAQVAATYAWWNHTGLFASDELDAMLHRIGRRLRDSRRVPAPRRDGRTVLHVATQAYDTGGHTQMIARWLVQEAGPRHRLCLTRQGPVPVPTKITAALAGPDDLEILDRHRSGLVERARRLRAAARDADIVVLHTHPHDVVPALAFATDDLPPIALVNHADHVFWVGRHVLTAVLNLRDSGRALAVERRGIAPDRALVMTRPLQPPDRSVRRTEAKRRYGVAPDQVLLVTAAAASKYEPVSTPGFLDVVVPVLQRHPNAVLLAAGPDPSGQWERAAAQTDGRVRALGRLPDVMPLHEAADIYLDSFPFGSLTSLLEAGSLGTPVVTFRGHPSECLVLGSDTAALERCLRTPSTARQFTAVLDDLIDKPQRRRSLGDRTRRTIVDSHVGEGWRRQLDATMRTLADLPRPTSPPGAAVRATGRVDVLVGLVQSQTGYGDGTSGARRENVALLPATARLRFWAHEARRGARPSPRLLLPDWAGAAVSHGRRLLRQRRHTQGARPT